MMSSRSGRKEPPITARTTQSDVIVAAPTEEAPETGEICEYGVVISSVEHWFEAGQHVFRSVEFDVSSEHEDEQRAVEIFVQNAEDLCFHLVDLLREKQATEHEVEVAALLMPRFLEIWKESERRLEEAQRRIINVPRRRRPQSWHRRSVQESSSQPLPV